MNWNDNCKKMNTPYPFLEAQWNDSLRVWQFSDYATGACLSLLEEFMAHSEMPEDLKRSCNEAISALHYILT